MHFVYKMHRLPEDAAGFLALLGAREDGTPVSSRRDCSFYVVQGALVISLFLQVVSHIFQKAKAAYSQQRSWGPEAKGSSLRLPHWCPNSSSLCKISQTSWEGERCYYGAIPALRW